MKCIYLLAGAVGLSACGGSVDNIQSLAFQTASTGHATLSDDITNASVGTIFTVPATTLNLDTSNPKNPTKKNDDITIKVLSASQIEVTMNGRTDTLTWNIALGEYTKATATEFIAAYTLQLNQYASISGYERETYGQNGNLQNEVLSLGIIGYGTNPNALPASANYNGSADLAVVKSNGDADFANGTAALNANFANGNLTGTLVFNDPLLDGESNLNGVPGPSASIDIGSFTMNVNGTITGNKMAIPVTFAPGDISAASIDPTTIDGGFYGPNAEFINGIGVGFATSSDQGANSDIIHSTLIDADRQ